MGRVPRHRTAEVTLKSSIDPDRTSSVTLDLGSGQTSGGSTGNRGSTKARLCKKSQKSSKKKPCSKQ